jgi:signal transduction histidine kinase
VPRSTHLNLERPRSSAPPSETAFRELVAVREIVHAFLNADRPAEVFQFALDRVSPLVGATFASVYLVDGVSEVMQLVAAHNWPEKFKPWLGETRVRLGFGPSGEAAAERRIIEVPDVFADPDLEDWQEVATELGFRSLVALPLQRGSRIVGAVTFYFAKPGSHSTESRGLLRIVADQMAATAEKSSLIDELRRANAALVETNAELERQYVAVLEARRLKEEFLANVSHELRTPLTSVLGYISIMQDELSGPLTNGQRNDLAQVKRSAERLLSLIEDLLELTALKRGDLAVSLEEFDPAHLLQDVVASVPGRATSVALGVDEPAPNLPVMHSDRRKIFKILGSLLSNAYKFTQRGVVRLSVTAHKNRVEFVVRDTGIGIAAESHEMIFDEFQQLDGSSTRRYGGSGLGLALSRHLARLLGGEIHVESALGEGSVFTLILPLVLEPAADASASPATHR